MHSLCLDALKYSLVADSDEEQYNTDDAQNQDYDSPEKSFICGMTVGMYDNVAFKIITTCRGVAVVCCCFLAGYTVFAVSDALPYNK